MPGQDDRPLRFVSLPQYLLIAEAITGVNATLLARSARIGLAESALAAPAASFGGVEAYPEFAAKAAVLVVHLCKNHPLPDGNKRCAFLAMLEFIQANGRSWLPSSADPDEAEQMIVGIAAGDRTVDEVSDWIRRRVTSA